MNINFEPLGKQISRQEIKDRKAQLRNLQDPNIKKRHKRDVTLIVIFSFIFFAGLVYFLVPLLKTPVAIICTSLFFLIFIVGMVAVTVPIVLSFASVNDEKIGLDIKLSSFAQANGLFYESLKVSDPENKYPGMIFNVGHDGKFSEYFKSRSGNYFEISNYSYVVGSGESSSLVTEGYILIKLNRNLPNIVLDSLQNNQRILGIMVSNLPAGLKDCQKIPLEGDFNNYFTLYAPVEYERDALYIFTPDFMSLLIDQAQAFDVEIIDDNLFIYSDRFDMADWRVMNRIFQIIEVVGAKTFSQTNNYADERVHERSINEVSTIGTRLKKKFSLSDLVIAIFVVALCAWVVLSGVYR